MAEIEQELETVAALYLKLAAQLEPERRGTGGRRTPPGSRPPLRVDIVSAMAEVQAYLTWWNHTAAELLGDRYRQNGQGEEQPP
jgi:hypothetical protein